MSVNIYDAANDELKRVATDDTEAIADIVNVYGSKNLLSYPYHESTKTQNGVTFTDNGDGTITVNGTATANANFLCHFRTNSDLNDLVIPNGTYILTGCPSGGATSSYDLGANRTHNGSAEILGRDIGNGIQIVLNGDDYSADEVNLGIFIEVISGTTVSNLTFRPMLRLASIEDDTYVPYAMTNRELTKATSIVRKFAVNTSAWEANTETATKDTYPYIADISSNVYKDSSAPVFDIVGTSNTGIPTAAETTAISLISYVYFSSTGITLYATGQPAANIVLRVKGE